MTAPAGDRHEVTFVLNDHEVTLDVATRTSLVDALRDNGFTGTHIGCEHGVCGACTGDRWHLCMCRGYQNIVRAARTAARRLREVGLGQLQPSRSAKERGPDATR